jgi:hypothetical protein
MKNILAILTAVIYCLLCSCYTKNQAIKKFCNQDTLNIETTIHDTIIVISIKVDTLFSDKIDSVYFVKDKIEVRYIKRNGLVKIETKYVGDTIFYTKTVYQKVPCTTQKLVWYKQYAADYWYILPVLLLIFLIVKYFHKILNNE